MNRKKSFRIGNRNIPAVLLSMVILALVAMAGCRGHSGEESPQSSTAGIVEPAATSVEAENPLAGTAWRLVEFQSMDDAIGEIKPDDPSVYTMHLKKDGTVQMRLNCNRANGRWSIEPGPDGTSGRFEFGTLAGTRALCPPPSMDEHVMTHSQYVRSYLMKDGWLYLSLMADGGIYAWEPLTEFPFETVPDKDLEAAILDASPDYTQEIVDIGGGTKGRYVYSRVDLNDDGRDEVFVYLLGSIFCGTGGCNLLLFTHDQDGYSLVNEFPISRQPVIVSPKKTRGWNELFRLESGGGAAATYVRHAFDGSHYVEMERTPADEAPEGLSYLAGELTFDQGIPLDPRN